jgi:hypothetical protein
MCFFPVGRLRPRCSATEEKGAVPDGDGGEGEEEAAPGEHVVPTAPMFSGEGGGRSGEGRSRKWVA